GVYQVTVFDSIGHVYADRLFFVTTPDLVKPTLTVSGVKEQYQPFEKVTLDIAAQSPATTLSLAVRDLVHSDNTFDSGNILTEMLLASEIKGFVPQPEYFFESDDEEHRRALDLLMLTQGWRRFSWREMAVKGTWELTHPAEHTPIVTGTVNRYYANIAGFDPLYDKVLAEHAAFMGETDTPLSELNEMDTEVITDFGPDPLPSLSTAQGYDNYNPSVYGTNNSIGRISYGWNLNAQRENLLGREDNNFDAFNSALNAYQPQQSDWRNDDYNALSYRTASDYRQRRQARMRKNARLYLEEGSVKRDVRVHAEFVDLYDERNFLAGETETRHGRFQIDMPRFEGQCVFFLGASDSTLWTKKDRPYKWVQVDYTDEYSSWPLFPEFYVRLNLPYPRWVKPYTYYQVHNAPLRDGSPLAPGLLTDGTHLLDQVTVRARHGGLRRIDYSKPAYVIDGYEALNRAMDAGLIDYTFSAYEIAEKAAVSLIGDMGMARHYEITTSYDSRPGFYTPYLAQRRQNMLTYLDQIYIYTDYSPRREGDERYEQSNQPSVSVDLRGMPNGGQRLTYRDRRYILDGYAFQEDFYQPDYQRHPPVEGQKDYRRTLYWNPELPLDADGHTRISFFNNSQPTSIAVQAAGQADDGSLLYNRE
nr:hypothetical protein [Bacteroidales bacterium]